MIAPRVDIAIVNWNSGPLLAACLRSIAASDMSRIDQIIVVDNNSTDASAELNVPELPLQVVYAGANLGFGRACNVAAGRGRAPYILFLNPDAEVFDKTISGVLEEMDRPENADVAVGGIRLIDREGSTQRHCARFPGWRSLVGEATGLARLAPGLFPPVIMREFDHLSSQDVDHVIGAFYCVRRRVFEQVGGFDEDYFVYFEDLDLSRRIADLGLRRRFLADVSAFHAGGGTSERIKARRLCLAISGRLTYARKHLSRGSAAAVWSAALLVEPLTRTALALARGSVAELLATWQGFAMLYTHLPSLARISRREASGA